MFSLSRFDDPADDPCVDVALFRGTGTPSLGTDGELEWNQTLDVDPEIPPSTVTGAAFSGGVVDARPIDLDLPVSILNADLVFEMREGALRVDRHDDGSYSGLLAGGVAVDDLIAVAETENVDSALAGILTGLLAITADLDKDGDGVCEQISITFSYEAAPAFVFED